MTTEYLSEKKTYYKGKYNYFKNLGFDVLAADFQSIVDLIGEMENCINTENKN
jgi:hypothetical protein